MSAAGHSSPPPTSAAVLEFICLFTHDLRRKQKRWQDGRLKYHTFNNRVMVYDDRGNFVGDMHWRHEWDLEEGEEVQLERGGVIVQVQELSSRCEQDLSELLEKRVKEKEQRQMQAVARTPAPSALPRTVVRPVVNHPIPPDHAQVRHRPLHQVIGTPSGHHGRAVVPKESPFEKRQQPEESPDQPATKRRKYDPPPSKSGYASALFGQALTLSATPTSSLPLARRRQIHGPDSSQEDEGITTRTVQDEPKPALREQPKVSRHFNQPSDRSTLIETEKSHTLNHRDVENYDNMARRKKERGLLRTQGSERRKERTPVDVEVIDLESPGAIETQAPAQSSRKEIRAPRLPKVRKSTSKSAVALPTHISDTTRTADDQTENASDQEVNLENSPRIQARNENPSESKTTLTKRSAKSTIAKSSAAKNDQHPNAATLSPRESSVPVTELRIKPRKKRGLMMMSDMVKKSHGQPRGNSTLSRSASAVTTTKEVGEADYSLRSPSPLPHYEPHRAKPFHRRNHSGELTEPENNVLSPSPEAHPDSNSERLNRHRRHAVRDNGSEKLDEYDNSSPPPNQRHPRTAFSKKHYENNVVQRKISKELGVQHDSSRPPASLSVTSSKNAGKEDAEDQVDYMGFMASMHEDDLGAAFQSDNRDSSVKSVGDTVNTIRTKSPHKSPQRRGSDPYRLPSSSPEQPGELSELPAHIVSTVSAMASPKADRSRHSISVDKSQSADEGQVTMKPDRAAKRRRTFLRNTVLDEDDELDIPLAASAWVEGGVDEPQHTDGEVDLKASKKHREYKQTTREQSKGLEASGEDNVIHPVKQAKPQRTRNATKGKPPVRESEFDFESEDEQPVKRVRATRKLRTRAARAGETPLPSESEDFFEEPGSRGSRKKKAKTSEDRPRLEKIKKSVKSRELIGFNFSALNAPLGLRGIGVPFSMLSSPPNESLQRKIDNHAAIEPPLGSLPAINDEQMGFAHSDVQQTIAVADDLGVDARSLEAGQSVQNSKNLAATLIPEAYTPRSGAEVAPNSAKSEIPQQIKWRDSRMVDAATAIESVATPNLQRQTSTASCPIILAREHSNNVAGPIEGEEITSVSKVAVSDSFMGPSENPMVAVQHENTSNVLEVTNEKVFKETEVETFNEFRPAALPSLPAYKVPEQKAILAPQRPTSGTVNVEREPRTSEEVEKLNGGTNFFVIPALPAFEGHVRKTTPALSPQASQTADVNTEIDLQHSGNDEVAHETAIEACPESVEISAEKPPSTAFRRQTPTFKPPTKAKVNTARIDSKSKVQCGRPSAKSVETELNQAPADKLPHVRSGSNSGLVETAGVETTAAGSDTTEGGSRVDVEPTSPRGKQKRVALHRTVSVTRSINNLTIEPQRPAVIEDPTPADSSTKPIPNARIANPASRGRKAAVKSDAKGPVPQRMLPPTQPFAMVPISTADFALTPVEEPDKVPERPKKKMTFPGFQSARGEGPWSREAFDLLESARPE